ncbi:hypothetical protein LP419_19635 [Massilia sp. H-1]|nr:hypothetical protein LP419_19635 [Massilia sp. H-1]
MPHPGIALLKPICSAPSAATRPSFDLANEDVLRKLAAALAKPRFYDAAPLIDGVAQPA